MHYLPDVKYTGGKGRIMGNSLTVKQDHNTSYFRKWIKNTGIYDFFGQEIRGVGIHGNTTKTTPRAKDFDPTNSVIDNTTFTDCDNWLFTRLQDRLDVYGTQELVNYHFSPYFADRPLCLKDFKDYSDCNQCYEEGHINPNYVRL
jgi:hypothetical protein